MKVEFGEVAVRKTRRGRNVGWYLDQLLVSILVSEWIKQHGLDRVKKMRRKRKQIDRSEATPKC